MFVLFWVNCILYIYSTADQSGSFSTDGISQLRTTNRTFVQCRSEHLTSFAVLVDATGVSVLINCDFILLYHTVQ